MKYKLLLVVLICCPVLLFGCNDVKKTLNEGGEKKDVETINKIGYSIFGGWIGKGYSIVIMPDSIHYFCDIAYEKEIEKYDTLTPPELWSQLIQYLDLNEFQKIESTPTVQIVDGSDREFFIQTNKRTISFINGEHDESFAELSNFFDIILKLNQECQQKGVKIQKEEKDIF